jgi:hypothetical protein
MQTDKVKEQKVKGYRQNRMSWGKYSLIQYEVAPNT